MLDALDDQELVKLVAERSNQPLHDVDWINTYEVSGKIQGRCAERVAKTGQGYSATVCEKAKKCCNNPHIPSAKLRGIKGCYKIKLRASGFRTVYQVIDEQLIIAVVAVGKRERSDVYNLASERMR